MDYGEVGGLGGVGGLQGIVRLKGVDGLGRVDWGEQVNNKQIGKFSVKCLH